MFAIRMSVALGLGLVSGLALAQTQTQTQTPEPPARATTGYALIDMQYELPAMPSPTSKHDVTESFFGNVVHDPYRWLEDADAPVVKQWIAAQNAYTENVMDGFGDAKAIARRVGELALTSTQQSDPEIVGGTLFYLRQTPPQPQAVLVAQAWPRGKARVLVDPNRGAGAAITGYWPSPDGKYVAYGTAAGGTEETTSREVGGANAKSLPHAVPHAGGGTTPQALVWDADGRCVTYARLPLPGSVPDDQLQFNRSEE